MNNRKIIKLGDKLMGMVLIVVMVMVMVAMITPLRHQLRVLIAYEREMRVTFYINSTTRHVHQIVRVKIMLSSPFHDDYDQ